MTSRYINGFIAGGLIGAAAAIMISSRSNNDYVKKKMLDTGKDMADAATKFIPGIKSK
ncbi:MAG: hypothetical protein GX352_01745 [Clostridiales bacterium]|nr:hypothetical protein [Clostridiales bacterium]